MQRYLAVAAALLGASGVMAGAFGAHALSDVLPPKDLAIWETAARYQLLHALAVLALVLAPTPARLLLPGAVMVAGVLVFSGSLYALVLTNIRVLGAITPVGGLLLIAGWLLLAWRLWRHRP